MTDRIGTLDLAIIALYLLGIVAVGCLAGLKRRQEGEANRYFLAAHSLRWPSIGMALFATNISCLHLVSLAQAGYDSGLLMGNFEWMAGFTLILLSLFFVPFYIRSRVATLPDFLEKRYCRECRDWLAVVSMVAAVVFHIAFPLSSGWIVLHGVFGIEKWTCILLICGLTALYTVLGGLAAVVMTETIQAIVLILGAVVITAFAYAKVGGWNALTGILSDAHESIRLSVLRSPAVEKEFPWFAIFLGYPVLGIWYWCADQTIVQRVLGAKDENHARIGPLFCAVIKILPVFIFVLPGLMFYAILKGGLLTGVSVENSKEVYGLMIKSLLPSGLFGVMAAALMAALMGNLASAANSISTLFSYDLWRRFRPETPEHQLVVIGRTATFLSFVLGVALVPLLDLYESIFAAVNDVIAHIAPPITCVFTLGIFWGKASGRGARYTMWIGSGLGALFFALKTLHAWKPATFRAIPSFFYQTPFMLMAFYLFCACVVLQVGLTHALPKLPHEDAQQLYWKSPLDALTSAGWPGLADYRVLAALVFAVMTGLYVVFR
ncbi:MAG: sodium:solute symporter family transporter [Isosphaeraceae bacterium]